MPKQEKLEKQQVQGSLKDEVHGVRSISSFPLFFRRSRVFAQAAVVRHPNRTTASLLSANFPHAMESAHKTITECMVVLLHMQDKCLVLSQLESVEKRQEEDIFDLKSRVVCWLEGLFEETGHLPASAMVGSSGSYFPDIRTAFSVIHDCIEDLYTMESEVHQMGVSLLSKGGSVHEMKREKVLRLKLSVVHQLKVLFKEIEEEEETSDEVMDVQSFDSADYEDEDEDEVSSFPVQREEPVEWWKLKDLRWSSVDEKEETNEKERYICLSNGHEIWCLDLNKSTADPSQLPKVATLSLLGEQLPSSVGLFKFGSDAYMIGGQELPALVEDPRGFDLYKALLSSKGLQASSRVTYLLSLAADKEDGTLSLSHTKACVEDMIKPKFWPIVERIGEKLHVFDSNPTYPIRLNRYRSFSHEVHNMGGDGGWKEIRTIQETEHIITHVVVGPLIYARTDEEVDVNSSDEREGCRYLMFDSRKEEWKGCTVYEFFLPLEVRRVRNILTLGIARCAGEFRVRGLEPLYVLIALARDFEDKRTVAVAYLVRLTGEVVCYQRLPEFFSKAGPLQPFRMETGIMFDVEEEEEVGPVRTMCSVITATIPRPNYLVEYLFINTFCVEVVRSDAVEQLLVQKASDPVELDFVRFAPKNWYIYNTDSSSISYRKFTGWRACFLTPSSP